MSGNWNRSLQQYVRKLLLSWKIPNYWPNVSDCIDNLRSMGVLTINNSGFMMDHILHAFRIFVWNLSSCCSIFRLSYWATKCSFSRNFWSRLDFKNSSLIWIQNSNMLSYISYLLSKWFSCNYCNLFLCLNFLKRTNLQTSILQTFKNSHWNQSFNWLPLQKIKIFSSLKFYSLGLAHHRLFHYYPCISYHKQSNIFWFQTS